MHAFILKKSFGFSFRENDKLSDKIQGANKGVFRRDYWIFYGGAILSNLGVDYPRPPLNILPIIWDKKNNTFIKQPNFYQLSILFPHFLFILPFTINTSLYHLPHNPPPSPSSSYEYAPEWRESLPILKIILLLGSRQLKQKTLRILNLLNYYIWCKNCSYAP